MNLPLSKFFRGKKIIAAWVCLGLVIITMGYLFAYQEKLRLIESREAKTQEILSKIYDLRHNITEAESCIRGYVITGDLGQLKTYQAAIPEISIIFNKLQQLTREDHQQQVRLKLLKPFIDSILVLLEKSLELRRQQGLVMAGHALVTQEGINIQDNIRQILVEMEDSEINFLEAQRVRSKKKTRIWLGGVALGGGLSLGLLLLILYFLNREITGRQQVEEKVVTYQQRLRSLASQLSLAEERERRRIAVYLHDHIGQKLAIANIKLGQLQDLAKSEGLSGGLDEIRKLVKQTIQDTKSLTFKISSPILYELGFEAALEWLTEEMQNQHGIIAYFEDDDQPKPLDEDIRILLFQTVSELLINVVKHARARHVQVSLWREGDRLRLGVADDGIGFAEKALGPRGGRNGGFGLFSIRERLNTFGGLLEIDSTPGSGTQITMTVPLQQQKT
jgi:signal transduction histidine kinase